MKKKLGLLSLVVLSIFLMAGSAGAVSFGGYNLGVEITVKDGIADSKKSAAIRIPGEDDETEIGTISAQEWDLEGMFWNAGSKTLSIVGGFDYLNGVKGESIGDLFIGDGCVLSLQRDGLNLSDSGRYSAIFDTFTTSNTILPTDVTLSGFFRYDGEPSSQEGTYQVTMGIDVGGYFSDWKGTNAVWENGSAHHLLQIFATEEIADLINSGKLMHLTLSCGNDTIHGAAPVPEPATVLLLGTGLLGVGIFSRRRKRQAL